MYLCLCCIMGVGWWALEEQVCNTNTVVLGYQAGFQFENESYFSPPKKEIHTYLREQYLKRQSNKPKRERIINTHIMFYG